MGLHYAPLQSLLPRACTACSPWQERIDVTAVTFKLSRCFMAQQNAGVAKRALRAVAVVACLLAVVAIVWIATVELRQTSPEEPSQADNSKPNRTEPSRGETGGRATVKLSPDQLKQIGLETAVLKAAPHAEQFRAYGAVVDIARITELTNSYANAQAQLQTAQAKFEVARSAFERTKNLVQSAALPKKEAEAAEGAFRTDQATLAAAESRVKTLAATAHQEWGSVIGKGIIERSPEVVRLIERDQFLVQVTLSSGVTLAEPPRTALAQAPTRDANIDLQYVSPATRTDPRIQGLSFFFAAPWRQRSVARNEHHSLRAFRQDVRRRFRGGHRHRAVAGAVMGVLARRPRRLQETTDQHRPTRVRRRLRRTRYSGRIGNRHARRTGPPFGRGEERASWCWRL